MKATNKCIIRPYSDRSEWQSIVYWCPACEEIHTVPLKPHPRGWDFSGTPENPTLAPSVKHTGTRTCHYFIADGMIKYCEDCHALASQTVDLRILEEWPKEWLESLAPELAAELASKRKGP